MNNLLSNSEERLIKMPTLINPKLLEVCVEPNTGYGSVAYDAIGSMGNLGFGFFKDDMEAIIKIYNGTLDSYSSKEPEASGMDHLDIRKNTYNGIDIVYYDNCNFEADCLITLDGKHFTELVYTFIFGKEDKFINKQFLSSLSEWLELN